MGLIDVYTRYSYVYVLKKKSDAAAKILEWMCVAENQYKQKLLHLRSDNWGEFTSIAFKHQVAVRGVTLQTTPPRSPEANGMAERFNSTIQDKTRTIMILLPCQHSYGQRFSKPPTCCSRSGLGGSQICPSCECSTARHSSRSRSLHEEASSNLSVTKVYW